MAHLDFYPRTSRHLEGALATPVHPGTKRPLHHPKIKLPGVVRLDPGQRIGIYANGQFVFVDCDLHKGRDRLAEMLGGEKIDTFTMRTPSGGRHLYFLQNPDRPFLRNKHFHALDIHGAEQAIVATGDGYMVENDVPPIMFPPFLQDIIENTPSEIQKRPQGLPGGEMGAGQDASLYHMVSKMVVAGASYEDTRAAWWELANSFTWNMDWPWTDGDFGRHWESASKWWETAQHDVQLTVSHSEKAAAKCELQDPQPLTDPKLIEQKRKAEGSHVLARDRRVSKKSKDWDKAPPGCWAWYDLLMQKFVDSEDPQEIITWMNKSVNRDVYLRWLVSRKLLTQDGTPLADARHKHVDGCLCNWPGWEKLTDRDPVDGEEWSPAEGAELLLPLWAAYHALGQKASRARYASLLQKKALELGKRAVTKNMITRWFKHLEGMKRSRIPGTKTYMWVRDMTLEPRIHLVEKGYRYRKNHGWTFEPPLYAPGSDPGEWVWERAGILERNLA